MRRLALSLSLLLSLATPSLADELAEAEKLFEADDLHQALEIVETLMKTRSEEAGVVGLLGQIRFELGDFKEGIEHLQAAAKLDAEVWEHLAISSEARVKFFYGEDEEAVKLCEKLDDGWVKRELPTLVDVPGMTKERTKGKSYLLYTDEGLAKREGDEFAGKVLDLIEKAYSKVFPFKRDKKIINRVYIFSSTAAYKRFNLSLDPDDDGEGSTGYFSPSTRILVIDADPKGEAANEYGFTADAIDTLFHEGFHQFLHMFLHRVPMWFDEGLAEYFGPSELASRTSLRVGVVNKDGGGFVSRYERIVGALRSNDPLPAVPLETFLTNDEAFNGDGGDRVNVSYAQAWTFIHFLLHSKAMGSKGKKYIIDTFKALREGKTFAQAHAETFGKLDLAKVEAAWREYVLNEM